MVELEGRAIGLIVNSASEVLKIPPSEIEAPHAVFQEGELNYITGVGKIRGRLVILLDLSRILQRGELRRLEEVAEFRCRRWPQTIWHASSDPGARTKTTRSECPHSQHRFH